MWDCCTLYSDTKVTLSSSFSSETSMKISCGDIFCETDVRNPLESVRKQFAFWKCFLVFILVSFAYFLSYLYQLRL